ncbi:MAG: hypothetical protein E6J88_00565 [Deltaproteobacteria bacterium]|nr:MAG: hypothetical protein E6J88_00565 [Deltaproteobacteria bacterium]
MLLIALLLAADVVSLTQESQVKDLCAALREQPYDSELDPAQAAAAAKAAQAKREEAAGRWYRLEVPSKGFVFGRYQAQDKQLELDGDRPLHAVQNTLSLDLDGVDDVSFHATPGQVSAWSKEKKAGTLRLVVVWKPSGERCAGSAAAEAWRVAGKARSWELVGAQGTVAAADAEGEPVGVTPKEVKIEKVTVESDEGPRPDDGRRRLAGAQRELEKCAAAAQRAGSLLVTFSVQGGRVRDPQVIMDSLRDEKVAGCVARAVAGAEVGGSGHGTAAISLE